jgi:metal-responsive CopG/Arc/MetJ family transcriptional regulator
MTKTIAVRVDDRLLRAVDAAREADHQGRSDIVREALELWLKRRKLAVKVLRHRKGYARRPVAADEFSAVLGAQQWPK